MENPENIVGIIGAGTMGIGIAQVAATAGFQTLLFDTNTSVLKKAGDDLKKTLSRLVEKGKITLEESEGIINRIKFVESTQKLFPCTIIIEAII